MPSNRSRQSGFIASINFILSARLPAFDLFLAGDSFRHRRVQFVPNEQLAIILGCEAASYPLAVLPGAMNKARGYPGIQRPVPAAGHDVYCGSFHTLVTA